MDEYEKIKIIGSGASGICHLSKRRDDKIARKVIIKNIAMDDLTSEEKSAVMREVTMLKQLNHPFVIGYYEAFKTIEGLSIVMQYAEGGTLDDMICEQKGVKLSESVVLNYFTQIAVGLDYMHSKRILHRDLKPRNILLNKKRTVIKLSDFGISEELTNKMPCTSSAGTPHYRAPEICQGRAYNEKSDIWSLGCVLYELCELKQAFEAKEVDTVTRKIIKEQYGPISEQWSTPLKGLIRKMINVVESARPSLSDILSDPLVMPVFLSVHVDVGALRANFGSEQQFVYAKNIRRARPAAK